MESTIMPCVIKDIENAKIFRNMSYIEVRDKIIKKELSPDTIVKIWKNDRKKHPSFPEFRCDFFELTMLHLAIFVEDEKFVDFLLANNCRTDLQTENLGPVIYSTIRNNKLHYVKKLIAAGADVNKPVNLMFIDYERYVPIIRDHHHTIEMFNEEYVPLEYAVHLNDYDIVETLLNSGAKVINSSHRVSALSLAVANKNIQMIQLLMKHGADINSKSRNLFPPLITAVSTSNGYETVKFLLSQPTIEVNAVDSQRSSSLHVLTRLPAGLRFGQTDGDILLALLEAGCDVNLVDNTGRLPIDIGLAFDQQKMLIMQHIIKLDTANLYVCERNLKAVSLPEFIDFKNDCCREIDLLKVTQEPITGVSYYNLLHRSQHKLALRLKNENNVSFDEEIQSKFPLYGGMVANHVMKACQRRELFNSVEDSLYNILQKHLPAIFIHELYFYFSNVDLAKLLV